MAIGSASTKNRSYRGIGALLAIIGALLLVFGLTLGKEISQVAYYGSAIPGVLLTIIGIFALFIPKRARSSSDANAAAIQFIMRVYNRPLADSNPISLLISMRSELDLYHTAVAEASANAEGIAMLEASILRTEREIRDFLSKFPRTDALTFDEATADISRKYQRYTLLLEYERERDGERGAEREKIKKLHEYVNSFLSLFKTSTPDPIGEIRRNLAEFDVLRSSLSRRRDDAKRFAESHGISESASAMPDELPTSLNFKEMLADVDEELISAEREKSRLVLDYNAALAETENLEATVDNIFRILSI